MIKYGFCEGKITYGKEALEMHSKLQGRQLSLSMQDTGHPMGSHTDLEGGGTFANLKVPNTVAVVSLTYAPLRLV